ncbi:MAG: AraC family transcriptional regulator [Erysipelotrichaceae bacterium]|nr:AraC family transcriptional regulator [Erysipelotrichaceae bacterium]
MGKHEYIKNVRSPLYKLIVFDHDADEKTQAVLKHWHNHLEISVCLEGGAELWVDGNRYHNGPGGVIVINQRSMHSIQGDHPLSLNRGYALQIDLNLLNPLIPDLKNIYYEPVIAEKDSAVLIELIEKLEKDEKSGKSDLNQLEHIISILKILKKHQMDSKPEYSEKLYEALTYVKAHFTDETLNNDSVAEAIGISTSHLNRLFRMSLNQSVHTYIMDLRVKEALNDIYKTDLKMVDIYLKNGFPNNKSFINEFKKRFGISPAQCRNTPVPAN